jgi:ABC-type microcin C transport system permease subunit YejE
MKKIVSVLVLLLAILFVGVSVALANTIYFPIVHAPAPTPTPTQTPIPGPILLPNGNFEQGHAVWNEYSNYGYDIIRYKDALNLPPHGGDWAAWLGGAINDLDELVGGHYSFRSSIPVFLALDYLQILVIKILHGSILGMFIDKHDLC